MGPRLVHAHELDLRFVFSVPFSLDRGKQPSHHQWQTIALQEENEQYPAYQFLWYNTHPWIFPLVLPCMCLNLKLHDTKNGISSVSYVKMGFGA
jgi:hypothetical protein